MIFWAGLYEITSLKNQADQFDMFIHKVEIYFS